MELEVEEKPLNIMLFFNKRLFLYKDKMPNDLLHNVFYLTFL